MSSSSPRRCRRLGQISLPSPSRAMRPRTAAAPAVEGGEVLSRSNSAPLGYRRRWSGSAPSLSPPSSSQSLGKVHRRATGRARGARIAGGNRASTTRRSSDKPSAERFGRGFCTIDLCNCWRTRRCGPAPAEWLSSSDIKLMGECAQAGGQALFLIFDGYGYNEAWSDGRGEPGRRQSAFPTPNGSSNIESPN